MCYMKDLQYILSNRLGVKPSESLDIMLGHIKPDEERIEDIRNSARAVSAEIERWYE